MPATYLLVNTRELDGEVYQKKGEKTHKIPCELRLIARTKSASLKMIVGLSPPKTERNILQVRLRRSLHDPPPDQCRTSEEQFLNLHVRGYGVTDGGAVSDKDVDYTWREPGFVDKRSRMEGGEGSEFG